MKTDSGGGKRGLGEGKGLGGEGRGAGKGGRGRDRLGASSATTVHIFLLPTHLLRRVGRGGGGGGGRGCVFIGWCVGQYKSLFFFKFFYPVIESHEHWRIPMVEGKS
jgi:hypothetical protein